MHDCPLKRWLGKYQLANYDLIIIIYIVITIVIRGFIGVCLGFLTKGLYTKMATPNWRSHFCMGLVLPYFTCLRTFLSISTGYFL